MTEELAILKFSRRQLFEVSIVALGIVLGLVWLLPSYSEPLLRSDRDRLESVRALRIVLPFVVAMALALFGGMRRRVNILDVLLVTLFIIWPQITWLFGNRDLLQLAMVSFPLCLSGLTILAFSVWPEWACKSLIIGIGLTAIGLITLRVCQYGFEVDTYYYRVRMHLGFEHPIIGSSALVASLFSALLLSEKLASQRLKILCSLLALAVVTILLVGVGSKNMMLFTGVLLLFSLARKILRNNHLWPWIYGFFAVSLVLSLVVAFLWIGIGKTMAEVNPNSTQLRIADLYHSADIMSRGYRAIWGLSGVPSTQFAVTDSIYTSVWIQFGVIGLFILGGLLTALGFQSVKTCPSTLFQLASFSGFWAVVLFFLGDAQGITPANLIIFLVFAMAYRWASLPHRSFKSS